MTGRTADPRAPDHVGVDDLLVSLFPAGAAPVSRQVQQRRPDRMFPLRPGTFPGLGLREIVRSSHRPGSRHAGTTQRSGGLS